MKNESKYFVIAESEITLLNGFETKCLLAVKAYNTKEEASDYIENKKASLKNTFDEDYRAFVQEISEVILSDGSIAKGTYCIPRSHEIKGTCWENTLISENFNN